MDYPLTISFKAIAFSNQGSVRDSRGAVCVYVRQKAFRLKESITVFTDESQNTPICTIKADRIIDFSPRYAFEDMNGTLVGALKRHGGRSLWKAHYTIQDDAGNEAMIIREESGWVKVIDGFVSELPIIGMFSGYMFHPSYLVTRPDGTPVGRIKKQNAFLEGKFGIEKLGEISPTEEMRFLLGCFTAIMLERYRG